jgi:hypothetical protein
MEEIQNELAALRRTHADTQSLLQSISVILALSEGRLSLAWRDKNPNRKEGLEQMADDIGKLYGVCHSLAELALGLIDAGRSSIQKVTLLLRTPAISADVALESTAVCARAFQDLTAAATTVATIKKFLVDTQTVLANAASRCDAPEDVRAEVALLFERLGRTKS